MLLAAGDKIAKLTANEAATVTSGASGGLVVKAAAAMAKDDPERIAQLPITNGMPNELIIQRGHRFIYDHLLPCSRLSVRRGRSSNRLHH